MFVEVIVVLMVVTFFCRGCVNISGGDGGCGGCGGGGVCSSSSSIDNCGGS